MDNLCFSSSSSITSDVGEYIDNCNFSSAVNANNLGLLKGIAAHSTRPLPLDYELGDDDVFCGRGCRCFNHIGNQRFRALVESQLERYSLATTKMDKTIVICEVVNYVRTKSPNGGFVKKDPLSGRFFEVGDFLAVSIFIFLIA